MPAKRITAGRALAKLPAARERLFRSFRGEVGRTQLVELKGVAPNGNRIFAKLEYQNPTGSHYDRVYPHLLHLLEQLGVSPKTHVLCETSSGNATVSFAHFARRLGYAPLAFMPKELSARRISPTRKAGAKVFLSRPGSRPFVAGARDRMVEALEENRRQRAEGRRVKKLFTPNHSQVSETLDAIHSLADELHSQLARRRVKPDYFLPVAGNGTIAYGVGKPFHEYFPKAKVIAIEPFERPALYPLVHSGAYEGQHGSLPKIDEFAGAEFFMPGSGALGIEFPHLESAAKLVDRVSLVKLGEWKKAQRQLAELGFSVGHTSAASFAEAMNLAKRVRNKNIVIIFYDRAERY